MFKRPTLSQNEGIAIKKALNTGFVANPLGAKRYFTFIDTNTAVYKEIIDERLSQLEELGVTLSHIPADDLRRDLLKTIYADLVDINKKIRTKQTQIQYPKGFTSSILAYILARVYNVRKIYIGGKKGSHDEVNCVIGVYDESEGIYNISESALTYLASQFEDSVSGTKKGKITIAEVISDFDKYPDLVPVVKPTEEEFLIPCNNIIFDYKNKTTINYSPEYVYIYKYNVNYNPNAQEPVCICKDGSVFHFNDFIAELFNDDQEDILACKYTLLDCFLPHHSKCCSLFYSSGGGGGKGTLTQMIEDMVGSASISLDIESFGKEYALESAIGKMLICGHENKVGAYIDDMSKFKATITHDPIQINRKHKAMIQGVIKAKVLQNVNDKIKSRDHSGSFWRRIQILEFPNCYRDNPVMGQKKEKREIKDDFLLRKEMQEFVFLELTKLAMYDSIPQSPHSRSLLEEMEEDNDIVLRFYKEVLCSDDKIPWFMNRIPFTVLYPLFYAWCKNVVHTDSIKKDRMFKAELIDIIKTHNDVRWVVKKTSLRCATQIYYQAHIDWQKIPMYRIFLLDCGLVADEHGYIQNNIYDKSVQFTNKRGQETGFIERCDCLPKLELKVSKGAVSGQSFRSWVWVDEKNQYQDRCSEKSVSYDEKIKDIRSVS